MVPSRQRQRIARKRGPAGVVTFGGSLQKTGSGHINSGQAVQQVIIKVAGGAPVERVCTNLRLWWPRQILIFQLRSQHD